MQRIWTAHYDRRCACGPCPRWICRAGPSRRHPQRTIRPAPLRYYGAFDLVTELDGLTARFAHALTHLREGAKGVVGIMLPNLPQTVIAYFGSLKAGASVTPINPALCRTGDCASECRMRAANHHRVTRILCSVAPFVGRTCSKRVLLTGPEDYLPWLKRLLYPWVKRRERRDRVPVSTAPTSLAHAYAAS